MLLYRAAAALCLLASSTAVMLAPPQAYALAQPLSDVAPPPTSDVAPPTTSTVAPPTTSTLAPPTTSTLTPPTTSTLAPSTTSTLAPLTTSTLAPSPTSTLAPLTTSTLAPPTTSTLAPPTNSTLAPSPTSTLAPPTTSTVAPPPTSTLTPSTTSTLAPPPTSTLAPSTNVYASVLVDSTLGGTVDVVLRNLSPCGCGAACRALVGCTAAAHDALTRDCLLTRAPRPSVTGGTPGGVVFLKTDPESDPSGPTVPGPKPFLSSEKTDDGDPQELRDACADEGGSPLVITSFQTLASAVALVQTLTANLVTLEKVAWLGARDLDGDSFLQWPDKSNVTDAVFGPADILQPKNGPAAACVLNQFGKIKCTSKESWPTELRVLCMQNLKNN
ncbi:mucin-5AC-like [Hyalella azteca]|uniref:Mucin-5AC-like n=1 Tax=Hyalella azteca TaxID=294128 RepID=A0A979FLG4_HYAAZ|nr:mucin-5AC-like [Hyalella azteca]